MKLFWLWWLRDTTLLKAGFAIIFQASRSKQGKTTHVFVPRMPDFWGEKGHRNVILTKGGLLFQANGTYMYDICVCTPWKINMEPTNQPFRKENDLPSLQGIMFHVNLPGCTTSIPTGFLCSQGSYTLKPSSPSFLRRTQGESCGHLYNSDLQKAKMIGNPKS